MEGPPQSRLSSRDKRLKLLNFLTTECQAAVMINAENHRKKIAKHIVNDLYLYFEFKNESFLNQNSILKIFH